MRTQERLGMPSLRELVPFTAVLGAPQVVISWARRGGAVQICTTIPNPGSAQKPLSGVRDLINTKPLAKAL